jgi:hypothetical protein
MSTAVVGRLQQGDLHVLHIDRDSGVCMAHSIALRQPRQAGPKGVAVHGGALFLIFAEHVEVYSLGDGGWIDTRELPKNMWWLRDRFFFSPQGWYALAFNGTTAQFEEVCDKSHGEKLLLISLFDWVGVDGPVAITANGEILCFGPAHGEVFLNKGRLPPGRPFRVAAISADGQRIVLAPVLNSSGRTAQSASNDPAKAQTSSWLSLSSRTEKYSSLIDLRLLVTSRVDGDPATALAANLLGTISNRTLRHKFVSIFVDGAVLVLVTHRGQICRIAWDSGYRAIRLQQAPPTPTETGGRLLHFAETPSPLGTGYRLSVAEWADGSRAYLDSRGLLHLKSSDTSIPELTLVLYDGMLAGWCANGVLFGPPYFTGDTNRYNAEFIHIEVLSRFIMGLR